MLSNELQCRGAVRIMTSARIGSAGPLGDREYGRRGAVTITKRELVIRVAEKSSMTQSDVARIIDETFESLARNLGQGLRWELRDFGVLEVKTRASRMGRNPRTGERVPVPARQAVTFRPGKEMRDAVSKHTPMAPPTSAGPPPTEETGAAGDPG